MLDDDEKVGVPKKSNIVVIVGILGSVTALVATFVGLTIFIILNRDSNDEELSTTNTSSAETRVVDEKGEANPGEENPARAEGEGRGSERKTPSVAENKEKTVTKTAQPDTARQLAALKTIRDWKNAATLKSIIIGNAKISISRIWLATDADGTSTRPSASPSVAAAKTAKDDSSPVAAAEAGVHPPKFVFVEVAVANLAGAPLKYKGWNIAKSKVPFMADDQDRILKLIPADQTPGVTRLTKSDIPGGGAISDILVFEAPDKSFETLRLMLPQNVFYNNTKNPYSGIEFTLDVLDNEGGPPVALPPPAGIANDAAIDPLVSGNKVPKEPPKPESLTPAEATRPATKEVAPPPKKPSLIEEVDRFEKQAKTKKMDEGKGTEPVKPIEPAKPAEPAKKTSPEPAKDKGKG